MEEWKQVAGRVQHMKICLIKAFRRTKKKRKEKEEKHFPLSRVLTDYALLSTSPI